VTRIVITGNPGVGKHTIGKAIAKKLNYGLLDLNQYVIANKMIFKSANDDALDVDIKTATNALKKDLSNKNNLIITGHLAPYLLRSYQVDFVAILRRHPKELIQVYKKRNYSRSKIKDNITCEILGVCSYDAFKQFNSAKIGEFDVSAISMTGIVKDIIKAASETSRRSFGKIDWISKVENEPEILEFILV